MRCIDIGCGGGAVTLEMARLVEPGGMVVGIDMDEVKVGMARRAAAERGVGNAEFRVLDGSDRDAIVAEGPATEDELAAALASLRRLADDERTLICGPRGFQLWSRRLNAGRARPRLLLAPCLSMGPPGSSWQWASGR